MRATKATHTWSDALRLGGLRRFAVAITVLNVVGHLYLGFEQSWAQPVFAVLTAYIVELVLEWTRARTLGQQTRFAGGPRAFIDFLLPAHITGLAVSMLLYSGDRIPVILFGTAVAIVSKYLFRARTNGGTRHFLNPSNAGITAVLLLFPWVGIAPPYQFTENIQGAADWALPLLIITTGTMLNGRFTHRLWLVVSWLGAFGAQALIRSVWFDTPLAASLVPMTGVAFVLFTMYMITDPATTPSSRREQAAFGIAVAAVYGILLVEHIVFGLFFALTAVSLVHGFLLMVRERAAAAEMPSLPRRRSPAVMGRQRV